MEQKTLVAPTHWAQIQSGTLYQQVIQEKVGDWVPKFFGYHLLKLGGLSGEIVTSEANIGHQFCLDAQHPDAEVIADLAHLPLSDGSIDLCLAIHQLEFATEPHHLLREINRVMVNDGALFLCGFNPFSLVGIKKFVPILSNKYPYNAHLFCAWRILDWLKLLNYEILCCDFMPTPNLWTQSLPQYIYGGLTKSFGFTGAQYFIVAKKRTYPVNLIDSKQRWKLPEVLPSYQTKAIDNSCHLK